MATLTRPIEPIGNRLLAALPNTSWRLMWSHFRLWDWSSRWRPRSIHSRASAPTAGHLVRTLSWTGSRCWTRTNPMPLRLRRYAASNHIWPNGPLVSILD